MIKKHCIYRKLKSKRVFTRSTSVRKLKDARFPTDIPPFKDKTDGSTYDDYYQDAENDREELRNSFQRNVVDGWFELLKMLNVEPQNIILGTPNVECDVDKIRINFRTKDRFWGRVYSKGHSKSHYCANEYSGKVFKNSK